MSLKELITIEGICERYGCERHTASAIIRKIPHFKVGKLLMVYERDLDNWEREQLVYPLPKGVRKPKQTGPYIIERRRA